MSHTNGPWRVSEGPCVRTEDGAMAADLSRANGWTGKAEDAHLIAAAPELLAACEAALSHMEMTAVTDDRDEKKLLRAAIAKARGR